MSNHQHEQWQLRPSELGGLYCRACGTGVEGDVDWGVRDKRRYISSVVALHPSCESAIVTIEAHPDWYEVVWSIRPAERKWNAA